MGITEKQKVGLIGENLSTRFLVKQGFKILERNYRKKWGEIDIVAQKDKKIHFVEVKTVVSRETTARFKNKDSFMPEDNVHAWKLKRLSRAVQTYLLERDVSHETEWQLDVVVVFLDLTNKKARFRLTDNVF